MRTTVRSIRETEVIDQLEGIGAELYACDWNPNGTNDVLIVIGSEIVGVLPEFCFGLECGTDDQFVSHSYMSHVVPMSYIESEGIDLELVTNVRILSPEVVIESIAVSPVHSVADRMNQLIREVTDYKKQRGGE